MNKDVILIQAGPPHLFLTTGIFYSLELSSRYGLVLIATTDYANKYWYKKVMSSGIFLDVVMLPAKNSVTLHYATAKTLKKLIKKYKPVAALMHSEFFVDNLYLIYLLKMHAPFCDRYYFQPGRMGVNVEANNKARFSERIVGLMHKMRFPTNWKPLVSAMLRMRDLLSYYINCKLFPIITIGTTFNPPVNYITGKIYDSSNLSGLADPRGVHLQYTSIEAQVAYLHGAVEVRVIQHPAMGRERQLLDLIGDAGLSADSCTILPSYGFTSMMVANGNHPEVVAEKVSMCWVVAIDKIKRLLPNHKLYIKLHPASSDDFIWKRILSTIYSCHSDVKVISAETSAESLIINSDVIVGDVSSSLWWAALLGNKKVISLDIFGYEDGDALKAYSELDVLYVSSVDEISSEHVNHSAKPKSRACTFTDVICKNI